MGALAATLSMVLAYKAVASIRKRPVALGSFDTTLIPLEAWG